MREEGTKEGAGLLGDDAPLTHQHLADSTAIFGLSEVPQSGGSAGLESLDIEPLRSDVSSTTVVFDIT